MFPRNAHIQANVKLTGFLLLLIAILTTGCQQATTASIKDGVLDLSRTDLSDTGVNLRGEWRLYPDRFLTASEINAQQPAYLHVTVPGAWTAVREGETPPAATGIGTYHLRIINAGADDGRTLAIKMGGVGSAYRAYINDTPVLQNGQPSEIADQARADGRDRIVLFNIPDGDTEFDFIVHVSNHNDLAGGFWGLPLLGNREYVERTAVFRLALDFVLFGALLIMSLYHLVLYFLRRREHSLFWFALMCLSLGTRALISGERFLYIYDWSVIHRLEYFSFYFSVSAVAIYFHLLYPREYYKWISYAFAAAGFLFCFTLVFMPAVQYTRFLVIFQLITGLFILYAIAGMILATVRRREQVFVFLSGTLTVSFCVTNDVLYNNGIYLTGTNNLSPLGWILFVFSQSTLLGTRLTHAFRAVENLTENLRSQATSFRRFVPDQFLNVLSREQVTEIELGDSRNMQMSVLFADIRSFTTLSETMSTAENIRFLNSYLKRMEPCITGHGGFIDKFIGDAIMALFQEQNSDAHQKNNQTDYARRSVQSAIDMLTELEVYNNNRVNSGYLPISIGIGIHAGEVMLGTIGSHNRLDTTVIGDAVNIAARLESLCKKYRTRILISKETYDAMVRSTGESQIDSAFDIREIDRLQVSGKNKPVTVMEVFNNDNEALKRQKAATRSAFQSARALFTSRRFTEALHAFQTLSKQAPDDYIYRMYIERCERFLANQPPSADAESMVPA